VAFTCRCQPVVLSHCCVWRSSVRTKAWRQEYLENLSASGEKYRRVFKMKRSGGYEMFYVCVRIVILWHEKKIAWRCLRRSSWGKYLVDSSWNVMAHGDAREGNWRGKWRMEWEASTLHTTSEHAVSSITTADAHNSAASSRLNWRPCRF